MIKLEGVACPCSSNGRASAALAESCRFDSQLRRSQCFRCCESITYPVLPVSFPSTFQVSSQYSTKRRISQRRVIVISLLVQDIIKLALWSLHLWIFVRSTKTRWLITYGWNFTTHDFCTGQASLPGVQGCPWISDPICLTKTAFLSQSLANIEESFEREYIDSIKQRGPQKAQWVKRCLLSLLPPLHPLLYTTSIEERIQSKEGDIKLNKTTE